MKNVSQPFMRSQLGLVPSKPMEPVTMELLNSAQGQKMLKALDKASPEGSFVEDDPANRKIEAAVTGDWYGTDGAGGGRAKITKAACQVMKLGESVLWVHTSYPTAF